MPEMNDSVSSPPFDYEATLNRVKGKVSLVHRLIKTFLRTSGPLLEQLRKALDEENYEEIYRFAHSLRGSCLNFDATRAAKLAEIIELQGSNKSLSEQDTHFQALKLEYQRLSISLQEVLDQE